MNQNKQGADWIIVIIRKHSTKIWLDTQRNVILCVCEIQMGFQLTFVFDNNGGTRIGINGYRMNTDDD